MNQHPDWLPDWRDATQYPNHGNDLSMWAWEFLRRNPEYQADWLSLGLGFDERPIPEGLCVDLRLVSVEMGGENPQDPQASEAWQLGKKWGLHRGPIEDPAHSRPVGPHTTPPFWGPTIFYCDDQYDEWEQATVTSWDLREIITPTKVALVFDLTMSLKHQWPETRRRLRDYQDNLIARGVIAPKTGRARDPELYTRYLRLLDADATGAKAREMAKCFLAEGRCDWLLRIDVEGCGTRSEKFALYAKTVEQALAAARKLRDGDYLNIIPRATAPPTKSK